tara:strand:+ start:828 stop:1820 length:993 start_codon:yes stop_codon:yes gene_type:complete
MKKTILVTGATGFIGSNLILYLLDKPLVKLILVDNFSSSKREVFRKIKRQFQIKKKSFNFYNINLIDFKKIYKIFNEYKIDQVIHLAAFSDANKSMSQKKKFLKNNLKSTENLINCMKKVKVKKIIFSSTAAIYGNKNFKKSIKENFKQKVINPYGKSKELSEKLIIKNSKNNYNYIILRFFNVVGKVHSRNFHDNKSMNLFDRILKKYKSKSYLNIYGNNFRTKDGTQIRDYIHVKDVSDAIYKLVLNINLKNQIFNIGNQKGYTVMEVFNEFKVHLGKNLMYKFKNSRKGDPVKSIANYSKVVKKLNWKPKIYNIKKLCKIYLNENST